MDPTSPGRLQGRVAVVTGGSSGLGRAGALRFAAEEAQLRRARLRVVYVWHVPTSVYASMVAPPAT